MRNSRVLRLYNVIFNFVARERVKKNDLDHRVIHSHITMVLSTGVLMWSYAFLARAEFSTPIPGNVGIAASIVHLLSPLLFLISSSAVLVCSVALGAGIAHQLTFAYFSGGFESCILQWLPILPLLGGYIEGRKSLILWTGICTVAIATYFGLHVSGHVFPMMISYKGYQTAQSLLLFGWLFILFCTTWVHVSMKENAEATLRLQSKKIDDLFRVLFHDLANSLGRINIGVSLTERDENPPTTQRGLQVIREAQESMSEITQNVRRMYAVSKGKADMSLTPCSLKAAVESVRQMFSSELEKKKLNLVCEIEKHKDAQVIAEPVSFSNQVLGNIVSNAIKFSENGGTIFIRCRTYGGQMVCLEVKDAGIGMPEVLLKSLFDMNKRTSRPGTLGESGTGFGMHIMKSFVEMYEGKVEVESVDREVAPSGSGTTIRLILRGELVR